MISACTGTTTFNAYACGNSGNFTTNAGGSLIAFPQRQEFPVTAGTTHTLVVTVVGTSVVSIMGTDTNRSLAIAGTIVSPIVHLGVTQSAGNAINPTSFATFNAQNKAEVAAKRADGYTNIAFADPTATVTFPNGVVSTALNSASGADMGSSALCPHDGTNSLHPNNCGYQHLADIVESSALGYGIGVAFTRQGPHLGLFQPALHTPNVRWTMYGNNAYGNSAAYTAGSLGIGVDLDTNGGYVSAFVHETDPTTGLIATSAIYGYQSSFSLKQCYGSGADPSKGAPYTNTVAGQCATHFWANYQGIHSLLIHYFKQTITVPEAPTFSATPIFDATTEMSAMTLTGNVTSSTLAAPVAGARKTFVLCQDATGGRTFTFPTTVKGAMTIGSTASTCSVQTFVGYNSFWYATSTGVINQ